MISCMVSMQQQAQQRLSSLRFSHGGVVLLWVGLAGLALIIASLSADAVEWTVQASSSIVLFLQEDVTDLELLAEIEQTFTAIVAYWGIDVDAGGRTPLGSTLPLCSVLLYSDREGMGLDLGRFDAAGMALPCRSADVPLMSAVVSESCDWSTFVVAASGYPEGDWRPTVARELTHVLQWRTWHPGSDLTWSEYALLREGMAEWTADVLGPGGFVAAAQSVVAYWLQHGGTIESVPYCLRYDVGTSLVERCVRLGGPQLLWTICSKTTAFPLADMGPYSWYETIDFSKAFLEAYGIAWDTFVADWASAIGLMEVLPGTEVRARWKADAFALRYALLWPLLCVDDRAELEGVSRAVAEGRAVFADLDRAEKLLRGAIGVGAEIDLAALTAREETLKSYMLRVEGARSDIVNVLRLGMLARRGAADVREYAVAFANAVNAYVPTAACLPLELFALPLS